MDIETVKNLANLARIDINEDELSEIAKDFSSILAYISQVQEGAKLGNIESLHDDINNYPVRNVLREDVVTNKEGEYTDKILSEAPNTENGYLKVKLILENN